MKHTMMLLLLVTTCTVAQTKRELRAGLGLVMGTQAAVDGGGNKVGIGGHLHGAYFISDAIAIAPGYTRFFRSTTGAGDATISSMLQAIHLDGRYYFRRGDVQVYGLAGFSAAREKLTTPGVSGFGPVVTKNTTYGVNVGAGVNLPVARDILANAQLTYQSPIHQIAFLVGASYVIRD